MLNSARASFTAVATFVMIVLGAGSAHAAEQYQVELEPLNGSGASGIALLTVDGNDLTVAITASGLVPNSPHAQHVHGSADLAMDFMCPGDDRDRDRNGITTTTEAIPDYGDIFISLTTGGDTSSGSGLAVDRMPVADAAGELEYERTIEVDDATIAAVPNLHVVQHGIDTNGNNTYDLSAGPSDLDAALPEEATSPATCGMVEGSNVRIVPSGPVQTGQGSTEGFEWSGLAGIGIGGLALGLGLLCRERRSEPRNRA